jgi:hypothetical protein
VYSQIKLKILLTWRNEMTVNKLVGLFFAVLMLNLTGLNNGFAASVTARCEVTGTTRSRLTVTGTGLSGGFYATTISGNRGYFTPSKVTAANGVVSFVFDSNAAAIRAGAKAIPANFIKNRSAIGYLRRAGSHVFVAGVRATCIAK